MLEFVNKLAARSVDPTLFLIGMGFDYAPGVVLLGAVVFKFIEHAKNRQQLDKEAQNWFATREMTILVILLFPFWLNSFGQFKIEDNVTRYIFFAIGLAALLFATFWHIWAKVNIGKLWSDDIEIKETHPIIIRGAFSLARHPMYASLLLWCAGCSIMLFNFMSFLAVALIFLPLMYKRAKDEEQLLIQKDPDYLLYQNNTRMLTPTIAGWWSIMVRVVLVGMLAYFVIADKMTLPALFFLSFMHLYFGYCFLPEKVAFSYRSKSGMIAVIGLISLYLWHPVIYLNYVIMAMCLYGLKWNCPCMLVYEKYHGCPCFALAKRCFIRGKKD